MTTTHHPTTDACFFGECEDEDTCPLAGDGGFAGDSDLDEDEDDNGDAELTFDEPDYEHMAARRFREPAGDTW